VLDNAMSHERLRAGALCGRRAVSSFHSIFSQGAEPMRIVYVLTSLGMGGAERQALALAARMARRGHAAGVLVLRPRLEEEWPTALEVFHLDMRRTPGSVLAGLMRGRRFLRDFRPDMVHSHGFHANIVARLLKLGVPAPAVLSTVHNVYEGGWLRMLVYRLSDGLSRRTAAVSEAVARRFVRLKAVPRRKCVIVPNGIDAGEFAPDPERRRLARAGMGVDSDFIWLAAGRIAPAKDYPNLLRGFARVRTNRPDARLWIAGEASAAAAAELEGLAADLGLAGSVLWLGLRRDLPFLLDGADAFVLSSAWEGMPLAVGEAMAMEKPVVATDAGGVRELVGEAGVVVPSRNPEALAEAMLDLMRQPLAVRQALGRAARERIVREFSMDARVSAWENLYEGMRRSS
jgi:glycosyltransferase involved in cell wall biosynthesis